MAKKLDRNKPYGVVQGEHNAAFEQDGVAFDIDGNELVSEKQAAEPEAGKAVAPAPAAKNPGRKKAEEPTAPAVAPAPAAVDEQLAAQGAE